MFSVKPFDNERSALMLVHDCANSSVNFILTLPSWNGMLNSFLTDSNFTGMCAEEASELVCKVALEPEGVNAFGILTDEAFDLDKSDWVVSFTATDSVTNELIVTDEVLNGSISTYLFPAPEPPLSDNQE